MGKGKKRPWIEAKKLAAAARGGGGGADEANRAAELERQRKAQKTAERAAREKSFRERHPERFASGNDDDDGDDGVGGGDGAPGMSDGSREEKKNDEHALINDGLDHGAGGGSGSFADGRGAGRGRGIVWQGGRGGGGRISLTTGVKDDENVDPESLPNVKPWMRSRESSLPTEEKEKRRARAEAITRQISQAAKDKQLGKAVAHYRRLVTHERLIPTSYTFASLINAYVNSGHMRGATAMLKRMKAVPGMAPNVVVYTTLLKGHMLAGNVEAAEALLAEMPRQKPPVRPDARAYNTFLRTALRVGDTARAWAAYQRMIDVPEGGGDPVTPDDATYKLIARLLGQGLRLVDLQAVIARAQSDAAAAKADGPGGGGKGASPCQFWLGGCCDRGATCQFYHDPDVTQRADVERLDAMAAMHVNLAHAAALLHEPAIVKKALEAATDALDAIDKLGDAAEGDKAAAGVDTAWCEAHGVTLGDNVTNTQYKKTTRMELRLELKRIRKFYKRVKKGEQERPDLVDYLARALVFSSQIEDEEEEEEAKGEREGDTKGGDADKRPGKMKEPPRDDADILTETLFDRLRVAYGLDPACESMNAASPSAVRDRLRMIIREDGTVDFAALFSRTWEVGESKRGEASKKEKKEKKEKSKKKEKEGNGSARRPVKLEICAGNGDWAVAQARADPNADWIALELRHDRVYSIFSRAVCEGVRNLCAMGGDAARVMQRNVRSQSVDHIFINFPEPPHHSGDAAADNRHHLLTPGFFERVHTALVPGGGLTLFSDNHRYMQQLARTLAQLHHTGEVDVDKIGEPMFSAEAAKGTSMDGKNAATFENVEGVRLYHGLPKEGTGHMVYEQSYFDRFWEQGSHTNRFFMVLSKN